MVVVQHPAGGMVGEPKADKTGVDISGECGNMILKRVG